MTHDEMNEIKAEELTPDFQTLFDQATDEEKQAVCEMLKALGL